MLVQSLFSSLILFNSCSMSNTCYKTASGAALRDSDSHQRDDESSTLAYRSDRCSNTMVRDNIKILRHLLHVTSCLMRRRQCARSLVIYESVRRAYVGEKRLLHAQSNHLRKMRFCPNVIAPANANAARMPSKTRCAHVVDRAQFVRF
jgi:hypothetical protein